MGHISDDQRLFSLWQNAGAYFHGHSVGGTNPALVQAMACGAPIVARDTVFNREVLGDSGRFVSPTPSAITAAIRSLLGDNDRQAELRRSARDRQAAKYTWDVVCKGYEASLVEASGG